MFNWGVSFRSGLHFSGDVFSDSSLNYDDPRNLPRQDAEFDHGRGLAPDRLYRSRLIVNADGYYEHIPATGLYFSSNFFFCDCLLIVYLFVY